MAVSERRGLGRGSPAEWGPWLLLLLLLGGSSGRIHRLTLTGEKRADIQLNSFGFYTNGSLEVNLSLLRLGRQDTEEKAPLVGFSLTRVRSGSIRSYSNRDSHECPLRKNSSSLLVLFLINTKDLEVQVRKYGEQKKLFISAGLLPESPSKPGLPKSEHMVTPKVDHAGTTAAPDKAKSKPTGLQGDRQGVSGKDQELVLGLGHLNNSYNFSFHVVIGSRAEEGQYNLNFHNCDNSVPGREQPFDITVMIREKNPEGYLSAAEIPLFKLYMVMSACFLGAGIFWVSILCKNTYNVFKIHWLMAALTFTKSVSLLFHSINYYFINSQGHPIEGLAVMHYITHLLKGALLFITIALIGSGWAFVKYVLSDKEKKIFGIVIPLQVPREVPGAGLVGVATHAQSPAHLPRPLPRRSWPTWPTLSWSPARRVPATTVSGRRSSSWWISSAVAPSCSPWSGPSGISRTRLALMGRVRLCLGPLAGCWPLLLTPGCSSHPSSDCLSSHLPSLAHPSPHSAPKCPLLHP
uniref:G protein-coupled receptor 108 n=1 Tax=Bos indicus x Bos taurus TaxID=30522 RepID=A0A4W2EPD7_BOBOX